ncbi:hypothetical protein SRB17_89470 [Streptomyces sp. RB17]|nr:hypothetical protein [Streptomyces sp. RB17]
MFVGIEREGERRTVKADALTAGPDHVVDDAVNVALRAAIVRLVREREAGSDAFAGPVYFMLHGVPSEERARELAAAFHAALYGGLGPLGKARARDVTDSGRPQRWSSLGRLGGTAEQPRSGELGGSAAACDAKKVQFPRVVAPGCCRVCDHAQVCAGDDEDVAVEQDVADFGMLDSFAVSRVLGGGRLRGPVMSEGVGYFSQFPHEAIELGVPG